MITIIGVALLTALILYAILVFVKYKEADKPKNEGKEKGLKIFIKSIRNVYYVITGWAIALALVEYLNIFGILQNSPTTSANLNQIFLINNHMATLILLSFLLTIFRFVIGNSGALEKRMSELLSERRKLNSQEMFIILWDAGWCVLVGCFFFFMAMSLKYWQHFLIYFFSMFVVDSIWILGDITFGLLAKGEMLLRKCVCKQWIISNFINMALLLTLFHFWKELDWVSAYIIFGLCAFSFVYDFFWPENIEHYLG